MQVDGWRKAQLLLMSICTDSTMLRDGLEQLRRTHMKLPNGSPCCAAYFLWVIGRSKNYWYKPPGHTVRQSAKEISIMAWFEIQKDTIDKMPDNGDYQIIAARRGSVHLV